MRPGPRDRIPIELRGLRERLYALAIARKTTTAALARQALALRSPGVLPVALRYYPDLFRAASLGTFPIGEVKVPTLTIYGANDPTAKYSSSEEAFYKGPYERIVLPGVGHWPHLEREQDFNRLVLEWFSRLSK
jgi:pimeloyl-ACP methyl ester carboxylesterase